MTIFKRKKKFKRFETEKSAIYIFPDQPDWIAVNSAGDKLLQKRLSLSNEIGNEDNKLGSDIVWEIQKQKFLEDIPGESSPEYSGRADLIELSHLDECWLHITNKCNLSCAHCLFSCSSKTKETLEWLDIKQIIDETYALGARIFYLTGGEPFVHNHIKTIITYILAEFNDTSLVILTNGILLPKFSGFFDGLPLPRLFFQVSVDGTGEAHEATRGKGSYEGLLKGLESLKILNANTTIAMSVQSENLSQMKNIVELACEYSVNRVHFMWLLVTGKASADIFVDPEKIFPHLTDAYNFANQNGIEVDNIRNIESQVFSPVGTKYDLGNAGWRSIAFGPDRNIYPTAAMIGVEDMNCGSIDQGIENVWKKSPCLEKIRTASVKNSENSPLKYLTGGGDIDHSYFTGGTIEGDDPYIPLYEKIALWIISENAEKTGETLYPRVQLKMGDRLLQCHSEGNGVSLTHSNCVLTFSNTRKVVGEFYDEADSSGNEDIINPVCYPEKEIDHIPKAFRVKSYGCGSPVLDSGVKEGEVVVDLGAGAGVECFIASKKTGAQGKVYGIDMLDSMLEKANTALPKVAYNLGYNNIIFKKGFLEEIPIENNVADLVVSNCVINLSEDKRSTLKEIFRVLKKGGRLIVSDVVTDSKAPLSIQNNEKLQGECIAGAMVQTHLFSILEAIGFTEISIIKRFFYREVDNHNFYSLTYRAYKPSEEELVTAVYPGPYAAVVTDDGQTLIRGKKYKIRKPGNFNEKSPDILILDEMGNASNIEAKNSCCSFTPVSELEVLPVDNFRVSEKNRKNCMVCGKKLEYLAVNEKKKCHYCSKEFSANAVCSSGHFVCDTCHSEDAYMFVKELLLNTEESDLITLMNIVRSHPSFNLHGPEHHFSLPGIIVTSYKNCGGKISDQAILTALERGRSIPGGTCAFWGGCGAPLGAGIGFGIILDSNPLRPKQRQIVQQVVSEIINEISKVRASRCCQRECWTTLLQVSGVSEKYLGVYLPAEGKIQCSQMDQNTECIKKMCQFYER